MSKNKKLPPVNPTMPKKEFKTFDSYTNFMATLGVGTDNVNTGSAYSFNFLTKNRILLEAMYRGSWIVASAVDVPADDMVQAGIDISASLQPDEIDEINESLEDLDIWQSLNLIIKWSRLYGSALGLLLIDGQDLSTELDMDTVTEGMFKGILPLDRWQVIPSFGELRRDMTPHMGMPVYYDAVPDAILPNLGRIHHTRVIRLDCIEMPHYQKLSDTLWAESIIERLNDRLIAFDSTTTGVAQLVYRSYLRTWSVENLREIIAAGGSAMAALTANIQQVRRLQTSEGITMVDAQDKFETHTYNFGGLDEVLLQFGQQLAGALEIPLVRLFGQSPAGLNSTGESDLRTYYDGIRKKQETKLRKPLKKILELVSRSTLGTELPKGFRFDFNPLWLTSDKEKAEIAEITCRSIQTMFESGIIDKPTALKELRQATHATGMFDNITDDMIDEAEAEPPLIEGMNEESMGKAAESSEGVRAESKKDSSQHKSVSEPESPESVE
jgi:phage-related protein (TIGR01555 family)